MLEDAKVALYSLLHILFCGLFDRNCNVIELYTEPASTKKNSEQVEITDEKFISKGLC